MNEEAQQFKKAIIIDIVGVPEQAAHYKKMTAIKIALRTRKFAINDHGIAITMLAREVDLY